MLRAWILRNKYKLMVFIVVLYLVVDVWRHKGEARLLFPKNFPENSISNSFPKTGNKLINENKNWKKAVNKIANLKGLNKNQAGFECDVYFNSQKNNFDVYHDPERSTGMDLETLLVQYQKQRRGSSIWLDFKNLNNSNVTASLHHLIQLKNKFNLQNKLLVESKRADLISKFTDSGFFTSYYTPMFNPYLLSSAELKVWADSISTIVNTSKVNALSGYYFQYPFLKHYFPNYPVLIWSVNDKFSLVNWLFKWKIAGDSSVFISLIP